jgi:hypothetical protein
MKANLMKKLLAYLAAVPLWIFLLTAPAGAGTSNAGKEFYLAFQPNYDGHPDLALFITGMKDTQGTIDIEGLNFHTTFTVKANVVTAVIIPSAASEVPINEVGRHGVHVQAGEEVSIVGLSQKPGTSDTFLALPIDALGPEYIALTWRADYAAQMVVVAAYDNTEVTITPRYELINHSAGVPIKLKLNKGETYRVAAYTEVTGTTVQASAPVAVTTGVIAATIPFGYSYLDHIASSMPPVSAWGKTFLTVPLATRLKGDFFRILSSRDNTLVKINGQLIATLRRGEFVERNLSSRSVIETSEPALVAQFGAGSTYDGVDSDPMQMVLTPADQFLERYTFRTLAEGYAQHFMNIVVPTAELHNLRLDGASIAASYFSPIGNSGFSGAQVPIAAGSHQVESVGGVPFGLYVYGQGYHVAYGYPGGMAFKADTALGDRFAPAMRLVPFGDTIQGSATDSEDANANGLLDAGEDMNGDGQLGRRTEDINGNGKLDAGEDSNGDGVLDRDAGIFNVSLGVGSVNLKLDVLPFVPGALSVQFSVSRIDPSKPGTGSVVVEDGSGNRAEQSVGLGLVGVLKGVRVTATLPSRDLEVDQASFHTAPASVATANGEIRIEWNFDRFPADIAKDLGFDILLKKPVPGEKREVLTRFELLYKDINGNDVRSELGAQSVAVLASAYHVVVSTDKPSYGANEAVQVSGLVSNLGDIAANASVRVTLLDGADVPITLVGTTTLQQIGVGGNLPFGGLQFSTATLYAGNYRLLVEVLDANNKVAASTATAFTIVSAAGAQVAASVKTDKREYGPYEQVRLSGRVVNSLNNASLDNARFVTQVFNSDGSVRFEKSEALQQLPPSGSKDQAYAMQLTGAAPGNYLARLTVFAVNGALLAQSEVQFKVTSSADTGAGLTATLDASTSRAHVGQKVNLSFTANNKGNSVLTEVPLSLVIVEPSTQRVIATYSFTANISIGGSYAGAAEWQAVGTEGGQLAAVLTATVGGKQLALAQVPLTVLTLSYDAQAFAKSHVLVLVSCKDDEEAVADPACLTTRTHEIDRLLTALEVPHKVVSDADDFKVGLRSGSYNTYWLSGKQDKLNGSLPRELRETVFNGEGLLLDGVHDQRNKLLDSVAGVRWHGTFGPVDMLVDSGGVLFPSGQFASVGRAGRLDLAGGTAQADFTAGVVHGGAPAIVSNQYGVGRTVQFAFDLPASFTMHAEWQPLLAKALEHVLRPYDGNLAPGQQVSVKFSVSNAGPQFQAQADALLPEGAAYVASTGGGVVDLDSRTIRWGFELNTHGEWTQGFTFAAPMATGSYSLMNSLGTIDPATGKVEPFGTPKTIAFKVGNAVADANSAIAALNGMSGLGKQAGRTRDEIVIRVRAGIAAYQAGDPAGLEGAIAGLAAAADDVESLGGSGVRAVHEAISRLLRECQRRWAVLQQ